MHPADRDAWRAWLERNHDRSDGVWLVGYKKSSGKSAVPYAEAVEEALCFGWIDGRAGTVDDERTMLWYSPRKPGSGWARTNKERIERLVAEGRMTPAGLARIEAAKADGSWTLLDSSEALEVPADLAAALAAYPEAARHFGAFPPGVRKNILQWISLARKPETRAARIAETARLANDNVRANQPRQRKG